TRGGEAHMVGVGVVVAAWLVAAVPPPANVEGGSDAQRAMIAGALAKIPGCWPAADGHEPPIEITPKPLWPGDSWNQVEAAYLVKSDPTYEKRPDVIWISPAFFDAALSGKPFVTSCDGPSKTFDAYTVL